MGRGEFEILVDEGRGSRAVRIREGDTVGDLLAQLGYLREEYIVLAKGRVLTEIEKLVEGSELRFIRVFSGG